MKVSRACLLRSWRMKFGKNGPVEHRKVRGVKTTTTTAAFPSRQFDENTKRKSIKVGTGSNYQALLMLLRFLPTFPKNKQIFIRHSHLFAKARIILISLST